VNSEKGREISRQSDRARNSDPERGEYKRKKIAQRRKDPLAQLKDRARTAVNNAIKQGKLKKGKQCEYSYTGECSGKLMAHHDDYSKPLDIRWLCSKHDYDTHHDRLPD
jgi:ribosomal protein S27AE